MVSVSDCCAGLGDGLWVGGLGEAEPTRIGINSVLMKRLLSQANVNSTVELGGQEIPLLDLLIGYFRALRHDLLENSNLNVHRTATFEAMVGIPANANSNQRFLTLEAFRRAGLRSPGNGQ